MNNILSTLQGKSEEGLMFTIRPAIEKFRSLGVLFVGIHNTFLAKIDKICICFKYDFQNSRMCLSSTPSANDSNKYISLSTSASYVEVFCTCWRVECFSTSSSTKFSFFHGPLWIKLSVARSLWVFEKPIIEQQYERCVLVIASIYVREPSKTIYLKFRLQ